ncbi:MAG: LD-carboxypeptidase [Planctomycetes bacterium]|nr:LD-carboxypeptidase [Planctomycetota bacterium]
MQAMILALILAAQPRPAAVPLKPEPLRAGDVVGLIAPAGPLDETSVAKAVDSIRREGFAVKLSKGYQQADGYLAASDEVRAAELNAMFRSPEVKAIICLRGGYGSPRILDRIDYEAVRQNPKIFVGYSDITAVLNALQARTGLVVFHGPMAKELGQGDGLSPFTARHFWSAFVAESPLFEDWGAGLPRSANRLETIVEGTAEGILVGGNLSVVTATVGTPFELDARDAILFLEEVNEKTFRIDRMLNQLRLAGKLSSLRGVLLGRFTNCGPEGVGGARSLDVVFREYFGGLGIPVLAGFPAGHVDDHATLPFGIRVRLDATRRKLRLLEAPVEAKPDQPAAR